MRRQCKVFRQSAPSIYLNRLGIWQHKLLLTLSWQGYFWLAGVAENKIEILKHFYGGYPSDQIYIMFQPKQTFILELWGFKVTPLPSWFMGFDYNWYTLELIGSGYSYETIFPLLLSAGLAMNPTKSELILFSNVCQTSSGESA